MRVVMLVGWCGVGCVFVLFLRGGRQRMYTRGERWKCRATTTALWWKKVKITNIVVVARHTAADEMSRVRRKSPGRYEVDDLN